MSGFKVSSSMSAFIELRDSILDTFREHLPYLRAVESHPGRFNLQELNRIATQLPAVRVSFISVSSVKILGEGYPMEEETQKEIHVRLAAFAMASDTREARRDDLALQTVEQLLMLIPEQQWDMTGVLPSKNVTADNLFSGEVGKHAIALWAVSWEQTLLLSLNKASEDILPSTLYTSLEEVEDEPLFPAG